MMGVQLDVSVVSWDYTSSSGALTLRHTTLAACVAQEYVPDPGQIGIPARASARVRPRPKRPRLHSKDAAPQNSGTKFSGLRGVQISPVKFPTRVRGSYISALWRGSGGPANSPVDKPLTVYRRGVGSSAARASSGQAVSRGAPAPPKAALGDREPNASRAVIRSSGKL